MSRYNKNDSGIELATVSRKKCLGEVCSVFLGLLKASRYCASAQAKLLVRDQQRGGTFLITLTSTPTPSTRIN